MFCSQSFVTINIVLFSSGDIFCAPITSRQVLEGIQKVSNPPVTRAGTRRADNEPGDLRSPVKVASARVGIFNLRPLRPPPVSRRKRRRRTIAFVNAAAVCILLSRVFMTPRKVPHPPPPKPSPCSRTPVHTVPALYNRAIPFFFFLCILPSTRTYTIIGIYK